MADTSKPVEHTPLIIPRPQHPISRANISKNALKVLYRLKDAGYQAFLVGGGVRDLLLGQHPKDFDVATDAHPEEVRALFANSRLIGRRFRLAHVRFGREIIEVATFRGTRGSNGADAKQVVHTSGRIVADNVYGDIDEDALRRDFTVNALYYNIADFSIWDFTDGVADIEAHCLRLIGDPERRYREDPVRMLRAARLAAKLSFHIHPETARLIPELAPLIDDVPPARLFDEFLKIFQTGHALASYQQLNKLGLFSHLFPAPADVLHGASGATMATLIETALRNTDERVRMGKPVTPMFLFGVLLWYPIQERAQALMDQEHMGEMQALGHACADVTRAQAERITLPRRFSLPMREMLQLQPRLARRRGKRAMNLLQHRRFRAAYDLLLLRAAAGEVDTEIAEFWTQVQKMSLAERRKAFGLGRRRRRSAARSRRPATAH